MRSKAEMRVGAAVMAACFASILLASAMTSVRAEESAPTGTAPPTAFAPQPPVAPLPPAAPVEVQLHMQEGDIVIALDAEHAPLTTANFLHYVDQKRYDGAEFYRAVQIGDEGHYGMLQGGLHGGHTKAFKPIAHESPAVTGLHHVDGAVSMARSEPGTATSEFFIVMGDLTALDGQDGDPGYAVFGHVQSGMDVVKQLLGLPRSLDAGDGSMRGQMLASPVKILSARRVVAVDGPARKPVTPAGE